MTEKENRELISKRFKELNYLNLKGIQVLMGKLQNLEYCHLNARQALETGETDTIAECVYILKHTGLVRFHYIEKHGKKYVDNTLGYLSRNNKYFLIRELTMNELKGTRMHEVLNDAKRKFLADLKLTDYDIPLTHL